MSGKGEREGNEFVLTKWDSKEMCGGYAPADLRRVLVVTDHVRGGVGGGERFRVCPVNSSGQGSIDEKPYGTVNAMHTVT